MTAEAWSALASSLGVIVAITALIIQTHRTGFVHSIDLASHLDAKFEMPEFRDTRRRAAQRLRMDDEHDETGLDAIRDVLNFFETLGFLYRKNAIGSELAWHYFASWLVPYWHAAAWYVKERQETDPNCYREIPDLVNAIMNVEKGKRGSRKDLLHFTSADAIRGFLEFEAQLPLKTALAKAEMIRLGPSEH
jgi:hypothetical protein